MEDLQNIMTSEERPVAFPEYVCISQKSISKPNIIGKERDGMLTHWHRQQTHAHLDASHVDERRLNTSHENPVVGVESQDEAKQILKYQQTRERLDRNLTCPQSSVRKTVTGTPISLLEGKN
jgi:hypothetical protein